MGPPQQRPRFWPAPPAAVVLAMMWIPCDRCFRVTDHLMENRSAYSAPGGPPSSMSWLQNLEEDDIEELEELVGVEIFDRECSQHIAGILRNPGGDNSWWLDTLEREPLVDQFMDRQRNNEVDEEWQHMMDADRKTSTSWPMKVRDALHRLGTKIAGIRQKIGNYFKRTKVFGHGGKIERFKKELQVIRNSRSVDEASVCSLDGATLKLLPFNRGFHADLRDHDPDGKCDPSKAPYRSQRLALGWLDADRVVRATQMAIFQTCYYKCVHFLADNFHKTASWDPNAGGAPPEDFCDLKFKDQKRRMAGRHLEEFLRNLLNSHESSQYQECQNLLAAGSDVSAELVDFAINARCHEFAPATPLYNPSENAPAIIYNTKRDNQPVCEADGYNKWAFQTNGRTCPEGTHCWCQRLQNAKTETSDTRKGKASMIFNWDQWGAKQHCSAIRRSGPPALVYVDAQREQTSKWARMFERLRKGRRSEKFGIAFMLASVIWFVVYGLIHSSVNIAGGGGAQAALGGVTTSVLNWLGSLAIPASISAGPAVGIGGGVVLGLAGLYFLYYSATFNCEKGMGCYPATCAFDETLNQCLLLPPKHGHTQMPLWWMPSPGLKCAYVHEEWRLFSGPKCELDACAAEEMAAEAVGYFRSSESKQNKRDLLNCQPLNVKDMTSTQQNLFLWGLRDERPLDLAPGLKRENRFISDLMRQYNNPSAFEEKRKVWGEQSLPECLTDAGCRVGVRLGMDDFMQPFCHPVDRTCHRPLMTFLEVDISDAASDAAGAWPRKITTALSRLLFDSVSDTSLFRIMDGSTEAACVDLSAPSCTRRQFNVVIRASNKPGYSTQGVQKQIQDLVGRPYTADKLHIKSAVGGDMSFQVGRAGALCDARPLPPNGVSSCNQPVLSGHSCDLMCEAGFKPTNTIRCQDGTWTDSLDYDDRWSQFHVLGEPQFSCVDVVCPRSPKKPECPRGAQPCFQWHDSGCERGGLSGSQPWCGVVPLEGYMLAVSSNDRWRCHLDASWQLAPGAGPPEIVEARCGKPPSHLIDSASGVTSVCDQAVSGVDADGNQGYCHVACTAKLMAVRNNRLRCTLQHGSPQWVGVAQCEPLGCDKNDLNYLLEDPARVIAGLDCMDIVRTNEQHPCNVICDEGYATQENTLRCDSRGHWVGDATCNDDYIFGGGGGNSSGRQSTFTNDSFVSGEYTYGHRDQSQTSDRVFKAAMAFLALGAVGVVAGVVWYVRSDRG